MYLAITAIYCDAQITPEEIPSEFSNKVIQVEGIITNVTAKQVMIVAKTIDGISTTKVFEVNNLTIPKILPSWHCVVQGTVKRYRLDYDKIVARRYTSTVTRRIQCSSSNRSDFTT